MTRLDRLVLAEIVGPFVGSALLFTGLFFAAGELVRYAEFLRQGESYLIVLQLMLLTLPGVIALTFPMAMLLATLLGMGRLSGDSETIALTAAGISFERIMLPVAVFALLVSSVGLWFNNEVVPAASRGRNAIINNVNARESGGGGAFSASQLTADLRDPKTGRLTYLVHVEGAANLTSGEMTDVGIQMWNNGRMTGAIYAPRARWQRGTKNWTLEEPTVIEIAADGSATIGRGGSLRTEERALDSPEQLAAFQGRPEDISTPDLRERAALLRRGGNTDEARKLEVEAARRNALPFSSLAFALIGAPLGVRPQRGGKGLGFGLSVIVTFLYWIGLQVCSVVGRGGAVPADIALMLPNLVCICIGVVLIRRVLRG